LIFLKVDNRGVGSTTDVKKAVQEEKKEQSAALRTIQAVRGQIDAVEPLLTRF